MADKHVDRLIKQAAQKISAKKDNDICRYIPNTEKEEGYIHHFTMGKMRNEDPEQLTRLIEEFIIKPATPKELPPKKRAARGSRKSLDPLSISRSDIDALRQLVRLSGNRDLMRKLAPPQDEKKTRRQLLSSIRRGEADQDLWHAWTDLQKHKEFTDVIDAEVAQEA